jgi:preprotein translocase subunit SecF
LVSAFVLLLIFIVTVIFFCCRSAASKDADGVLEILFGLCESNEIDVEDCRERLRELAVTLVDVPSNGATNSGQCFRLARTLGTTVLRVTLDRVVDTQSGECVL